MGRYSKATEHQFGRLEREALLDEARRDHAAAIDGGLHWLEQAARAVPAVGAGLTRP
jgi:hypothetical protein